MKKSLYEQLRDADTYIKKAVPVRWEDKSSELCGTVGKQKTDITLCKRMNSGSESCCDDNGVSWPDIEA